MARQRNSPQKCLYGLCHTVLQAAGLRSRPSLEFKCRPRPTPTPEIYIDIQTPSTISGDSKTRSVRTSRGLTVSSVVEELCTVLLLNTETVILIETFPIVQSIVFELHTYIESAVFLSLYFSYSQKSFFLCFCMFYQTILISSYIMQNL